MHGQTPLPMGTVSPLIHAFAEGVLTKVAVVEACLAACAACFLGLIESLVEYFNRCVG